MPIADLEECLECPICLEVPKCAPIYQCRNGHILCNKCKAKITVCPSCQEPMGTSRSLLAEKLLEKVPVKCKFAENGCGKRMMSTVLRGHETTCAHRDIQCYGCLEKHPMSAIGEHIKTSHKILREVKDKKAKLVLNDFKEDLSHSSKGISHCSYLLSFEGRDFFFMLHRRSALSFRSWVYSCQFKEALKNTRCRIQFSGFEIVTYEGPVISAEVNVSEVDLGMIIAYELMMRIVVSDGFSVTVEILDI